MNAQPTQPRPNRVIVFVHGLGGDSSTWKASTASKGWPELAQDDTAMVGVRSEVVNYPANICSQNLTVKSSATAVISEMQKKRIFDAPSVVFVAHSLGGLVVKQAYIDMSEDQKKRITDVSLIASPSQGASIAAALGAFCKGSLAQQLTSVTVNQSLQTLNDRWDDARASARNGKGPTFPRVHCAYETLRTNGVFIVERADAVVYCDERLVGFNETHLSIAKPTSYDADIYKWFRGWIQSADKVPNVRAQQLISEVLQKSHRRALALNIAGRFVLNNDIDSVYASVRDMQKAFQIREFEIGQTAPEQIAAIVYSISAQLEGMTASMRAFKDRSRGNSIRVDGSDRQALELLCNLEHQRIAIVSSLQALAKTVNYRQPLLPPAYYLPADEPVKSVRNLCI